LNYIITHHNSTTPRMSQSQWKEYFSKFVLGQTNYSWYAIVESFNYKTQPKTQCHCCGENSMSYYCSYCEGDICASCGEIGCGSYMCRPCRQDDDCY